MNLNLIIGLIVGIPLFVLGLFLCAGKFISLLAGFHTAEQQKGYDAKKVSRAVGVFLLPISALTVCITSEDTAISVTSMILIPVLCVILIVLVNTLKYFKE